MVATPSTMVSLGEKAPRFMLENPRTGGEDGYDTAKGTRGTLVMFICNHCPYVIMIRERLLQVAADALAQGIGVIAINANSEESHPQDGPPHMKALADKENWPFPYVFDRGQEVALQYQAACTPDFFLFDADDRLFYRGQFDEARPNSGIDVTGKDLQNAIDTLIAGGDPPTEQWPSLGCNIKWKEGNAPAYFG